jgi:hypothetical protein
VVAALLTERLIADLDPAAVEVADEAPATIPTDPLLRYRRCPPAPAGPPRRWRSCGDSTV